MRISSPKPKPNQPTVLTTSVTFYFHGGQLINSSISRTSTGTPGCRKRTWCEHVFHPVLLKCVLHPITGSMEKKKALTPTTIPMTDTCMVYLYLVDIYLFCDMNLDTFQHIFLVQKEVSRKSTYELNSKSLVPEPPTNKTITRKS